MATSPDTTGAPTGAPSNIVPFQRRPEPLAYLPGVIPFDRTDPAHVRAWNTLFQLGWSQQKHEGTL